MGNLYDELNHHLTELHPTDQQWLQQDLVAIAVGGLALTELMQIIKTDVLPQIKGNKKDHDSVNRLVEWYKRTSIEQYMEHLGELEALSTETKGILGAALQVPKEDFRPMEERVLDIKLLAVHSDFRSHFYAQRGDLFMRNRSDWLGSGVGVSMLPTLSNPCDWFQEPLHPNEEENTLDKVKRGDIVSFLIRYKNGNVRPLGKRITGLPGDAVRTIQGNNVRVPKDCFWAEGDNAEQSSDSRHFGAVPAQNLRARVLAVLNRSPLGLRFFW